MSAPSSAHPTGARHRTRLAVRLHLLLLVALLWAGSAQAFFFKTEKFYQWNGHTVSEYFLSGCKDRGLRYTFVGRPGAPPEDGLCVREGLVPALLSQGHNLAPGMAERLRSGGCRPEELELRIAQTPWVCALEADIALGFTYEPAERDRARLDQRLQALTREAQEREAKQGASGKPRYPVYRVDGAFSGIWVDFALCKAPYVHITQGGADLADHDCADPSKMPPLKPPPR